MTRSFLQGTRNAQGSVKGRRKPWLLPSSLEQGHFDSDGDHIRWPACQSHSWNCDPALCRPQAPVGPSGPGSSSPTSNYSQEKLSSKKSEQGLLMPWRCVQHHRASFCCGGSVCRNLRPDMPGHSPACLTFSFRDLPPALPELMKRQTEYQGHIQGTETYICAVLTQTMGHESTLPLPSPHGKDKTLRQTAVP